MDFLRSCSRNPRRIRQTDLHPRYMPVRQQSIAPVHINTKVHFNKKQILNRRTLPRRQQRENHFTSCPVLGLFLGPLPPFTTTIRLPNHEPYETVTPYYRAVASSSHLQHRNGSNEWRMQHQTCHKRNEHDSWIAHKSTFSKVEIPEHK